MKTQRTMINIAKQMNKASHSASVLLNETTTNPASFNDDILDQLSAHVAQATILRARLSIALANITANLGRAHVSQ